MLDKFVSRKFVLAVAAAVSAGLAGHGDQAIAIVLAYLGVEGVIDFKAVHKHVNHAISVVDAAEEDAADGDVDAVDDLEQGLGGFIDHEFWPDEDEEEDPAPPAASTWQTINPPITSRTVGFHA